MTIATLGEPTPTFSLSGLDGRVYRLQDVREPVLLAFFKVDCETCRFTFPYLQRLFEAYPQGGWHLWGISQDSPADSNAFARELGATFPILLDEGWAVSHAYDPEGVPTVFFIEPDGQLARVVPAFQKAAFNELSAAIAERIGAEPVAVIPGNDPSPPFRPG